MKSLFSPAVALMRHLKYPQKFALISALFALPLVVVLFLLISEIDRTTAFSQKETRGTAYLRPLRQLYEHSLENMLISQEFVGLTGARRGDLERNHGQIDSDINALQNLDQTYGVELATAGKVQALKENWELIKPLDPQTPTRRDRFMLFVKDVQALITHVANSSNLALDSDIDSSYLIDSTLVRLVEGQDLLAQTAVLGHRIATKKEMASNERADLLVLSGLMQANLTNTEQGLDVAMSNNPSGNLKPALRTPLKEHTTATRAVLSQLSSDLLSAPTIKMPSDSWMDTNRKALAASFKLWDAQIGPLDSLLNARINTFTERKNIGVVVSIVVLLIVAYLWIGFYLAMMRTVSSLEAIAKRLASGNMGGTLELDDHDEMGKVAAAFNTMASAANERTSELTQVASILAHLHDGIVITDAEGRIETLNHAACRLLGTDYQAAMGNSLSELTRDLVLQDTLQSAIAAPARRQTVDLSIGGFDVAASITAIPDPAGGSPSGLVVLEDVTELRRLQRARTNGYAAVAR